MKNEKELSIEQETVKDCPILYCMRYRPMMETAMCWGWECGHGWDEKLQEMSYQLETLNLLFYPKYRVRIQLDQVKEKFGLATIYYSVAVDHGRFITSVIGNLNRIADICHNHDFKFKRVIDVEPFDYDDITLLTKEEFEEKKNRKIKCSNVEYIEENGHFKEIVHLRNYGKTHQEATENRLWWKLGNLFNRIARKIYCIFDIPDNSNTRMLRSYLYEMAHDIIKKTEDKCYNTCEDCGSYIGTDWSPRCETTGWITYICDKCAEKHTGNYYKNGELWHGDKCIETKQDKI